MDLMAIDDISIITGMQVEPVVATGTDIMAAVDKYYGNEEARAAAEAFTRERETMVSRDDSAESEDVTNAPVVMLVKTLIEQAVRKRASDIHVEPLDTRIRVRNRVDGVLVEVRQLPAQHAAGYHIKDKDHIRHGHIRKEKAAGRPHLSDSRPRRV